jgi:hypothetical protein
MFKPRNSHTSNRKHEDWSNSVPVVIVLEMMSDANVAECDHFLCHDAIIISIELPTPVVALRSARLKEPNVWSSTGIRFF